MDIQEITSLQNPRIKNVVRLRTRKDRDEARTMIIEGEMELERALAAGVVMSELYFCAGDTVGEYTDWLAGACAKAGAALFRCPRDVFRKIAYGDRESGVLALAPYPDVSLGRLRLPPDPLVVVLEAVEKPGNLGAVLRSADGAGADAVIVADPATDLFNPNTVRASRGALFTVPVATGTTPAVLSFLRANGIAVLAAVPGAEVPYTGVDMTGGTAIVLGTEHDGLTEAWTGAADHRLVIPMRGKADSLNVAVAATIMMFEALRQRSLAGGI